MKTIKKVFSLMICLGIFVFTSCNNDDDASLPVQPNTSGSMSAKIDGASWSAAQSPASLVSAVVANGVLALQGGDNSGNTIRFNINGYNGVGVYTTGDNVSNTNTASYVTISPVASWTSTFDIGSGTIEVTSVVNGIIEGTFSFTGLNSSDSTTKTITEGVFSSSIQ